MTTTELSDLDARAAHLAAVAETKRAAYHAALAATKAALDVHSTSQARLEAIHGDDWYMHTDAQHDASRRAWVTAMQVRDRAGRAHDRAERAADRAGQHRVVRTYTDSTGWVDNPSFFGRQIATP